MTVAATFAIPGSGGIRPSVAVALDPLTMEAAAEFWRGKIKLGPGEFKKLSDEAKLRAFAISGIAKGDELDTVFKSLQAAIENGISYGDFKKECAEIFARRGWTGKREWRVQNIFRTNIQTAYNIGRYQSQKANADVFPFLQYNAVNDRRTRPTHKALDGKVFPIDHPFWDTWYPPNGYRCRCSTLSLTKGQVERMGLQVGKENPTDSPIEIENPVTGAKMTVQQLLPDPGFAQHPGKVWLESLGEMLAESLEKWPEQVGKAELTRMIAGGPFGKWYEKPSGNWPVGVLGAAQAEAIGATSRTVLLSGETVGKQKASHPELFADEYRFVQGAIDRGEQIKDGERSLIFILEDDSYVCVVKSTITGKGVYVTSFRRLSKAEAKRDAEIRRLREKGR